MALIICENIFQNHFYQIDKSPKTSKFLINFRLVKLIRNYIRLVSNLFK